jgi:hypothetical protein
MSSARRRWRSLLTLAVLAATSVGPAPAGAQTAVTFTMLRLPAGGPPGTLVFLSGTGCPGSSVQVEFAHADGLPGTAQSLSVAVAPDGTWFLRALGVPADAPAGRYRLAATCVVQGGTTQPAVSDFFVSGASAIRPEPVARSAPSVAAVRGFARLDVFVQGGDGAIQWSTDPGAGAGWSGWSSLGAPPGGAVGEPAAVSWALNRLDVFVRGADDKLWQRFSTDGGVSWSGWIQPVGTDGVLASSPDAASRGPGRLDVVVQGTDGHLYQRFYENDRWNPSWLSQGAPNPGTPTPPAGVFGTPGITSPDGVRVSLFARDSVDGIWHQAWNGSAWSGWVRPDGFAGARLASSPDAASWGPGHETVVVRGTDSAVYQSTFIDGWFHFRRIGYSGEVTVDRPAVASRQVGRLDVLVRGTDDRIYAWTVG